MLRCVFVLAVLAHVACGEVASTRPDAGEPVDAAVELDAPTDVTLTITSSGAGTVSSSPSGIDCGATCSMTVPAGTVVTLTAVADVGSVFGGWTGGDCAADAACEVTVDADTTVAAAFVAIRYTLDVTFTGIGTGTVTSNPVGIACDGDCTEDYEHGTVVTLTAADTIDGTFAGWSGGGCTGTLPCVTTMTAAQTVNAQFDCPTGNQTFDYTGGPQTVTLPSCISSITVDARGAAGGIAFGSTAAIGNSIRGGRVQATVPVTTGDVITVVVGRAGGNAGSNAPGTGGFNGGAVGSTSDNSAQAGGGGGGASDVRRDGARLVVAGGAGGTASCGNTAYPGGAGGGLIGGTPATGCGVGTPTATSATGGTQSAGGAGGFYSNYCTAANGTLGNGAPACGATGGAGAGGGYYGGGGGAWNGGGGGSSFAAADVTAVTHTQGFQSGNGQVIISW